MQEEPTHKSFFSSCEMKDQVNLQLALCWLKGSLVWNYLHVGNAHTLTYCLRTWEVLSRRQVKSCLSGEKISAKSLDKTLGSMHWLSPSEKVNQAFHLHPFPALTKVAKPIAVITQPSVSRPVSISIHLASMAESPIFSLYSHIKRTCRLILEIHARLRRHKCAEASLRYLRKRNVCL